MFQINPKEFVHNTAFLSYGYEIYQETDSSPQNLIFVSQYLCKRILSVCNDIEMKTLTREKENTNFLICLLSGSLRFQTRSTISVIPSDPPCKVQTVYISQHSAHLNLQLTSKRVSISLNTHISVLDEHKNVLRVPLKIGHCTFCTEGHLKLRI